MESESAKHDAAYAVAQLLYDLQEKTGRIAFGQFYVTVKDALNCYEARMHHLRKRIVPIESEN